MSSLCEGVTPICVLEDDSLFKVNSASNYISVLHEKNLKILRSRSASRNSLKGKLSVRTVKDLDSIGLKQSDACKRKATASSTLTANT